LSLNTLQEQTIIGTGSFPNDNIDSVRDCPESKKKGCFCTLSKLYRGMENGFLFKPPGPVGPSRGPQTAELMGQILCRRTERAGHRPFPR
jgi:hypothetical protein